MKNSAVLLEKKTVMVYNVIMDKASFEYLTEMRRTLNESSDPKAAVVGELKRLGYKPKLSETGVYADVGRGQKTMLSADACDISGAEHMAVLLSVARNARGMKKLCVRFHFKFGDGGDVDGGDNVFDGVSDMYAVRTLCGMNGDGFGYCYGTAFAGSMTFALSFVGGEITSASEYMQSVLNFSAEKYGVTLKVEGCEYTIVYYDSAKGESVLMDIERGALEADDLYRTEHDFAAIKVLPPIVNSALCVDRARAAAEYAVELTPQECSDEYAQYLAVLHGCIVCRRDGDGAAASEYDFLVKLIGVTA